MSQNFFFCIFQTTSLPRTQVCACYVASVMSKSLQCYQASLSMGILQAILECVAIPSSRRSFWPRNWTCVSLVSCTGRLFTTSTTSKAHGLRYINQNSVLKSYPRCDGVWRWRLWRWGHHSRPLRMPYKRHCRICFPFLSFMWGHSEEIATWQLRRESLENPVTLYFNIRLFILQNNKK